jgi:hypothetical protein
LNPAWLGEVVIFALRKSMPRPRPRSKGNGAHLSALNRRPLNAGEFSQRENCHR